MIRLDFVPHGSSGLMLIWLSCGLSDPHGTAILNFWKALVRNHGFNHGKIRGQTYTTRPKHVHILFKMREILAERHLFGCKNPEHFHWFFLMELCASLSRSILPINTSKTNGAGQLHSTEVGEDIHFWLVHFSLVAIFFMDVQQRSLCSLPRWYFSCSSPTFYPIERIEQETLPASLLLNRTRSILQFDISWKDEKVVSILAFNDFWNLSWSVNMFLSPCAPNLALYDKITPHHDLYFVF